MRSSVSHVEILSRGGVVPNWTDVVQAVISLAGFAVVIYQLWQLQNATHGETHSRLYGEDYEAVRLFIDHPELRPYFYNDVEPNPASPDYTRALTAAELYAVHFEHILMQMNNLPEDIRKPWRDYIKGMYARSPIVRRHLQENRDWYSTDLHDLVGTPR
jgi:hypothetical protein